MDDKKAIDDKCTLARAYQAKQYEDWLGLKVETILTSDLDLSKSGSCDLTGCGNAIVDFKVSGENYPILSFYKVTVKG